MLPDQRDSSAFGNSLAVNINGLKSIEIAPRRGRFAAIGAVPAQSGGGGLKNNLPPPVKDL